VRGKLPSMEALRAFEAAARNSSFTLAALELGISQSAISRVIATLEKQGGIRLFERIGRRLVLTEAGERFARDVRPALATIAAASSDLAHYASGSRELNVCTLPTFGSHWLAPRLARFARSNPRIRLRVDARVDPIDFENSTADCAIFYGIDVLRGALIDRLLAVELQPVCAAAMLPRKVDSLAAFPKMPLLQHSRQPNAWFDWLDRTGRTHPAPGAGHWFDTYEVLIRAAIGGMGVALVRTMLVERELASGELVALHEAIPQEGEFYCFVYPERKRTMPELQKFRSWILRESRPQRRGEAPISTP
jgi:LysR family transcriptional regulator, glycine cleavage system transcriptional activator